MSPSVDRDDPGFTLVEVVVAIGILMTLLVAVLPQLIGGIRATDLARGNTQAKGLASAEIERMRNLPFYVAPLDSTPGRDFVDLFDRYFQDLTAPSSDPECLRTGQHVPPTDASSGFVADGDDRCEWEPNGPFYRVVRSATGSNADPDLRGFVLVVATQFLGPQPISGQAPPWRAPRPGYDTDELGSDVPVTSQVGVTVTVLRDRPSERSPVSVYTQIARSYETRTQVRAAAEATALEVAFKLPGQTELDANTISVAGGLLRLDSSVVASSRVQMSGAGLTATASTGENEGTTRTSASAPPSGPVTWSTSSGDQLIGDGCEVVCWGGGDHDVWDPITDDGLPGIGSPTDPVDIALKTPSTIGGFALRVGMGEDPDWMPGLGVSNPLVRMRQGDVTSSMVGCRPSTDGGNLRLHSAGWAQVTDHLQGGGADACAATHTAEVSILPYAGEAPRVTVQLRSAYAHCQVSGPTHDPGEQTFGFTAEVKVYDGNGTEILNRTLTEASPSGALPDPDDIVIGSARLSRWIDSWSFAREDDGVTASTSNEGIRIEIPAIVSVVTQPLRQARDPQGQLVVDPTTGAAVADEGSSLSVTVGSVSCEAEDHR